MGKRKRKPKKNKFEMDKTVYLPVSPKKTIVPLLIGRYKEKIIDFVKNNQVVIVTGQTGCGKSTQVPQYLFNSGLSKNGIIACLHPKCIAAMTLSQRVAEEMGTEVGYEVGYQVRFYNMHSRETKIMFMTVGFLLRTLMDKSKIKRYSVIIVDEAHERCVETDLILAQMKILIKNNSKLKLVIMSATLDVKNLQNYFDNCPEIRIAPKPSNVAIAYNPVVDQDYVKTISTLVIEIVRKTTTGHILIFLPGEEKIWRCKGMLRNAQKESKELNKCVILELFSNMDYNDKTRIFMNHKKRKIIISTNVAETSVTIDDVQFVIDSGKVKRVRFDNDTRVEHWSTEWISLAEADQRKGRAGRTKNVEVTKPCCYRMYPEKLVIDSKKVAEEDRESSKYYYDKVKDLMIDFPPPDILKANLSFLILFMKSVKMPHIKKVDFLTRPDMNAVKHAIQHLIDLSLLNENEDINSLGLQVSKIPLDPRLAKVVHISSSFDVWEEVFAIASMLSVGRIFTHKDAASKFSSEYGDLFRLLNVFNEMWFNCSNYKEMKPWCFVNGISFSLLKYAYLVFEQLKKRVEGSNPNNLFHIDSSENTIIKCLLSGYFQNLAGKCENTENQEKSDKKSLTFCTFTGGLVGSVVKTSCIGTETEIILFGNMKQISNNELLFLNSVTMDRAMLMNFRIKDFHIKPKLWNSVKRSIERL